MSCQVSWVCHNVLSLATSMEGQAATHVELNWGSWPSCPMAVVATASAVLGNFHGCFFCWYHLPCICNSLELEPDILHDICHILACSLCMLRGICYSWPCSPSILHGICHILVLQTFMWVSFRVSLTFHLGIL